MKFRDVVRFHVYKMHNKFFQFFCLIISMYGLGMTVINYSKNELFTGLIYNFAALIWIANFVSYRPLLKEEKIKWLLKVKK